jgi:site-specific DNA recombinase
MAAPAPAYPVMTSPQPAAAPVPVAVLARTSTLQMQDPLSSLRRQFRACQDWLPPGFVIVAWYWDVESGGIDLEDRSQTANWEPFAKAGLPRDGGMADLLREAAAPEPRFAAVVCEDIERSGRDTFNALKLERTLADNGVLLFATDEPADIAGANPTTVLVRRVKQGVAEWFRLQIKQKSWKGLQEHSLAGWNVGPAPYGYLADRIPHPVPYKAAQGKVKTRLALDPDRAPVVAAIFRWRTEDHLGTPAIAARLTADPASYPPPAAGWTASGVWAILRNPKTPGTWSTAAAARSKATTGTSPRTSGYGPPNRSTPPSSPATNGKPPRPRAHITPPPATDTTPAPTPPPAAPTGYADASGAAPASTA